MQPYASYPSLPPRYPLYVGLRTWDKGDGVLATELGWLEDVRLDRGICWEWC